ncbi:MAG: DMT family transporter [Coriobacteriia bacterium]|nr:DMT family transporter [Coriobacteriia bacterium]
MAREYFEKYGVQTALIVVAAIWGCTFVVVADAIALYPMYGFLFWRFAVAALAFVVFFPAVLRRMSAVSVRRGLVAGLLLSAGYIFQTLGLDGATRTTPARAAFITGLYVVFTPLLQAVVLRKRPRKSTMLGGVIALSGLWILSGIGAGGGWVLGDTFVAICALAYSVHMIVLGMTDETHDIGVLTLVQLVTVALVCGVISVVRERPPLPTQLSVIMAILVCGVLASAFAFVVQTWAQSKLAPSRVALILVTEPAFGGVFGWAVAGVWPIREILGAATMFAGMIVAEAMAAMAPSAEKMGFEPAVEGIPAPIMGQEPAFTLEVGQDSEELDARG